MYEKPLVLAKPFLSSSIFAKDVSWVDRVVEIARFRFVFGLSMNFGFRLQGGVRLRLLLAGPVDVGVELDGDEVARDDL